jgi:peptidoglycan/LPS O-acetylase OafA/YrhL
MTRTEGIKRIPNLTSIRFILALFVMLYHIPQFSNNRSFPFFNDWALFHRGSEAVWMFFSLSGFLILKQLYVEKKATNSINILAFYRRRILRIFPLYYLIVAIGFLYYQFVLPGLGFEFESHYNLVTGLILSLTFFANIFSTFAPGGILEILWSIAIEEQFYLFAAPLCFLLKPKKIISFLGLFSAGYFVLYFSPYFEHLRPYNMLFFFFSFGGLCAILMDKTWFYKTIFRTRYLIFTLVVMVFTTPIFKGALTLPIYTLLSFVLFGLFIAAMAQKPIRWLENNTLNYLGKISYGLYVFHAVILQGVGLLYLKIISKFELNNFVNILIINALVITFTIIISHFSYAYFELYFLKKKRKT